MPAVLAAAARRAARHGTLCVEAAVAKWTAIAPADVHARARRVDHHRVFAGLCQHDFLPLDVFTPRVSLPKTIKSAPALASPGIALGQFIRPGNDVFLLAAMAHTLFDEGLVRLWRLQPHVASVVS